MLTMSDQEDPVVVDEHKEKDVSVIVQLSNLREESSIKAEEKTTEVGTMNATNSEDSEYETLEEDNGESSRSSRSRRSSFSEREELSDDINIEDEREDGDGEEENSVAKDKKLDDDEDRRNPQYIPKKGTFYEHDDRTMMDDKEEESNGNDASRQEKSDEGGDKEGKAVVGGSVGPRKGKVWTEKADRWSHDLYIEEEQVPKSTQELINTYGYDIRNEEAPPKARRRRKYGRGPNKYTRNWEDEDAYMHATPGQRRIFHNNKEEFPDLTDTGRRRRERPQDPRKNRSLQQSQILPASAPSQDRERGEGERGPRREREVKPPVPALREREPPAAPAKLPPPAAVVEKHTPAPSNNYPPPPMVVGIQDRQDIRERKEPETRVGRGRGFRGTGKPRPTLEFTASRGRAGPPLMFNREPAPQVQDSLKHAADMLIQDFSHVYINNNNNTNNIVEETIIPRSERRVHHGAGGDGHSEPTRSKRYSTQRQRSLPENTPPPAYSPPHNIPYYTQPPPANFVPGPVYNEVASPPVTSPPMQMVAFLPPGPPPTAPAAPPYPPPPLLNYMPPPTFPPMALQPPQISGQFDDLSQSAELFHGQGGITYYSTQSQLPRPNPPRRIKLAIPIVPPPGHDKSPTAGPHKQRGGPSKQQEVPSAAS